MKVRSAHEREMSGSIEQAIEIVKTYGTLNDQMHPDELWPKIRSVEPDGPPAVGKVYIRGAVRFMITFFNIGPTKAHYGWKFIEPAGFNGRHESQVEDIGNRRLRFKTFVEIELRGIKFIILWFLIMRPFHNAVVEDCLDKAERKLGNSPKGREWSLWVKLLRRLKRIKSVEYQRLHQQKMAR
jgi:hypothetical protein